MRISAGPWPGSLTRSGGGFGVECTLAGMDVLAHRIEWTVQVPARRAAERDEAAIAAWREARLNRCCLSPQPEASPR
jgi:hypothetical protein